MKKNKFIALALAAGMTFCNVAATGVVAYADQATDTTYTLTIPKSTNTEHALRIYQIFSGQITFSNGQKTLSNIEWGDGVVTDTNSNGELLVGNATAKYQAEQLNSDNIDYFAEYLVNGNKNIPEDVKIKDNTLTNTSSCLSGTFKEATLTTENDLTVELPAGYYLVLDAPTSQKDSSGSEIDSSSYTKYMVQIVGDTTETIKADAPSSLKKVKENNSLNTENAKDEDARISGFKVGAQYNDVADYSIGETIPYELVGTLPSNYDMYKTYTYQFVDKLSKGLTLDGDSVEVYFKSSKTATEEPVASTAYDVKIDKNENSFTVSFDDLKTKYKAATKDSVFVVRYKASLNSNAVIGLDGNENTFHLVYSNNPNMGGDGSTGETPEDKNIVFTYELDNTKITYMSSSDYAKLNDTDKAAYTEARYDLDNDGKAETVYKKVLSGAKFKLYDAATNGKGAVVDSNGKFIKWTETATEVTELVSDANGLFKIAGLDEGTYYLEETEAPSGYNKITGRQEIKIEADTLNGQDWENKEAADAFKKYSSEEKKSALRVTINGGTAVNGDVESGIVKTEIVNMPGAVLPSTGGVGTTIMYILGGILVIGGGAAIFIKRKKDAE